jgi:DNA-binding NarL/FixJ family response regulator
MLKTYLKNDIGDSFEPTHKQVGNQKIRLAIVGDSQKMQAILTASLKKESTIDVVLAADNGADLLAKLKVVKSLPHIIVMEINMPVMNGVEATEKLLLKYPAIKIIAFSVFNNDAHLVDMFMNGTKSFVSKTDGIEVLIKAIKLVHSGTAYVNDYAFEIIKDCLFKLRLSEGHELKIDMELANQLSSMELKILWYISQCKTIKEIADLLCLSPNTINNRLADIRKKLGLKGKKSLLQFALSKIDTLRYYLKKLV